MDRFCNPWWLLDEPTKLEAFVASDPRQKKIVRAMSENTVEHPYTNVTAEHVPRFASVKDLHKAYGALLPQWFRRLRVPDGDVSDAAQDVWLEVSTDPAQIPANENEARRILWNVSARVAERLRDRAKKAGSRRHPTTEPEDVAGPNMEERASIALALLEQLDSLDESTRRLVIASKVFGFTDAEIAESEGLSPQVVQARIWRACAKISQKLGKSEERCGALLMPGELVIDGETRAAFCAIWEAEGRLPQFGGPKGPPPPPPPFFPVSKLGALPLSLPALTPKLVALALLVSLPLLGGLALVLALLMRPRERPPLARSSHFTPSITVDVSCSESTPSPATTTPSTSSSARKPYAQGLDTQALEALSRTVFTTGKADPSAKASK